MRHAPSQASTIAWLLCLLCAAAPAFSSIPSRETLGIAPQDEGYYRSSVIKCKDGSKKFTKEQLNDEYCDCPDGTDEPGTSACPGGKFYCRNSGHTPILIFSSRVNDGICDCCDGSDEYNSQTKCLNTCWEAGKVAREKLRKKIVIYQEGVSIRNREIKKAHETFAKDQAELSKLKSEESILKGLVQKLKEHKEQIEKAEEEERLKREKEEQRLRELENKARENEKEKHSEENPDDNAKEMTEVPKEAAEQNDVDGEKYDSETEDENPDTDHKLFSDHGSVQVEDEHTASKLENVDAEDKETTVSDGIKEKQGTSEGTKGLSKEELGRLVASRWTGETADHKSDNVEETAESEEHKSDVDTIESTEESEDFDGYHSEADEKYDDDDEYEDHSEDPGNSYEGDNFEPRRDYDPESEEHDSQDLTMSNTPSWLHKIQQHVQNFFNSINLFKNPVNISEAAHVRKEYDDASSRLSKMQSRISSLTEKFKQDFGPEKEFYSFYDHCFENKESKYVYKVCPYKQASQVEGYSTTRLGNWENFEESYRAMRFVNGDRCWNGPDRSLKVRLRCGVKNELADVDEPSRCEYVALLSTPAVCTEEKLKELKQKLERMNSGQPTSHDEL